MYCNKIKQGNVAVVYDGSGTHDSGNVPSGTTSDDILPMLLAVQTVVPIKLDRRFVGSWPVLGMFDME